MFKAGFLDKADPAVAWCEVHDRQQRLCDHLERCHDVRFVTPQGTDVACSIEGRNWVNCDGHINLPDGEVFTAPIEDSTNGIVCFSTPVVHEGQSVDGIRLEFRAGRVIDAYARVGESQLIRMLDRDDGARMVGELALGTNYRLTQFTRNELLDEKVGGTFHVALGVSYPSSGGKNVSAIHCDMVCGQAAESKQMASSLAKTGAC